MDPRALQIHTDGSALRNPGHKSGCAAIARYPEHLGSPNEPVFEFSCPRSTNQRMELMACIGALRWARGKHWDGVTRILIVTDSEYVKDYIVNAVFWKKDRWHNRDGKPISNSDLWDELVKLRSKVNIRVDFVWALGKESDIAKQVHRLAKAAAKRGGPDVDWGYQPGAFSRSTDTSGKAATPFAASGQVVVIRPYRKTPVLKGEERVSFTVFDEATQTYGSKFSAVTTSDIALELHRGHGWRVRFNSEPKHPQIIALIEEVPLPTPQALRTAAASSSAA